MDLYSDVRFNQLQEVGRNQEVRLSEYFALEKWIKRLEEVEDENRFDIIYFDAFAPSKQPEIWSIENLERCYESLKSGGVLTTYCVQNQFKRNLASVGFEVEVQPEALGKKEEEMSPVKIN